MDRLSVTHTVGDVDRLTRVLRAGTRDPNAIRVSGGAARGLFALAAPIVARTRPRVREMRICTVESNGAIVGAYCVNYRGYISNLTVTDDPGLRAPVLRTLFREFREYIDNESRALAAYVLCSNVVLRRHLRKGGFLEQPGEEVLVVLPLGPFSFPWKMRSVSVWLQRRSRIEPVVNFTRQATVTTAPVGV